MNTHHVKMYLDESWDHYHNGRVDLAFEKLHTAVTQLVLEMERAETANKRTADIASCLANGISYLYCLKCGEKTTLQPGDAQMGITMRKVYMSAKKPEHHGLTVNGVFKPVKDLICDRCSDVIAEGETAVAVTMMPPGREIGPWESEYGKVLDKP